MEDYPIEHSIHKIPEITKLTIEKGDILLFNDEWWHQVKNYQKSRMYNIRYFKNYIDSPFTASLFFIRILSLTQPFN